MLFFSVLVMDPSRHFFVASPRENHVALRQTDAQLPQGEAIDVQVKFIGNPGGGDGERNRGGRLGSIVEGGRGTGGIPVCYSEYFFQYFLRDIYIYCVYVWY